MVVLIKYHIYVYISLTKPWVSKPKWVKHLFLICCFCLTCGSLFLFSLNLRGFWSSTMSWRKLSYLWLDSQEAELRSIHRCNSKTVRAWLFWASQQTILCYSDSYSKLIIISECLFTPCANMPPCCSYLH